MAAESQTGTLATEISLLTKTLPPLRGELGKVTSTLASKGVAAGIAGSAVKRPIPATVALDLVTQAASAYLDGTREGPAYTNAKTMTGNYVGLTNDQIQQSVAENAKKLGITQARVSDAAIALIATGKVQGSVLGVTAAATAQLNRVRGVPNADTAKEFAELGREPTKKSAELNDRDNYLTLGTYNEIQRLEKSGKKEAAGALAQEARATDLLKRLQQVTGNQAPIDKAKLGFNDFSEVDLDTVRGFAREDTYQKRIDELDKEIGKIRAYAKGGTKSPTDPAAVAAAEFAKNRVAKLTSERDGLAKAQQQDLLSTLVQKNTTRFNELGIAASQDAEEADSRRKANEAVADAVEKRLGAKGTVKPTASLSTNQGRATSASSSGLRTANAGIQRAERDGLPPCIEAACGCKKDTPDQEKQCDLKDQANKPSQPQTAQSEQKAPPKPESVKTADEKPKTADDELEKKTKKLTDDIGGVFKEGFVSLLEGGGRDAIDKIGKGLQKKLTQSVAEALYDVTLKDAVAGFSKLLTGALKGPGAADGAPGVGGGGLLGGLGDMVKGLFGGISNMFSGIWDFASSGISSLFSGGSSLFSGLLSIFSAKGNVFASSGLHAYANSVVGKPTFFPFAHGIGLMGEAGPEAIMPLRRGSDGRLGVSAPMGGSGGGSLHYAPTNVFNIDSRSDRGAMLADLDRALQVNNQGQMEQLKRLRVVPQ